MANVGKIKQIIGPVVDVSFEAEGSVLPLIMNALEVKRDDGQTIILEVQQHLGEDAVRTVATVHRYQSYRPDRALCQRW
jgi:F-type H+-transporting ATPase subunit beta